MILLFNYELLKYTRCFFLFFFFGKLLYLLNLVFIAQPIKLLHNVIRYDEGAENRGKNLKRGLKEKNDRI